MKKDYKEKYRALAIKLVECEDKIEKIRLQMKVRYANVGMEVIQVVEKKINK